MRRPFASLGTEWTSVRGAHVAAAQCHTETSQGLKRLDAFGQQQFCGLGSTLRVARHLLLSPGGLKDLCLTRVDPRASRCGSMAKQKCPQARREPYDFEDRWFPGPIR